MVDITTCRRVRVGEPPAYGWLLPEPRDDGKAEVYWGTQDGQEWYSLVAVEDLTLV